MTQEELMEENSKQLLLKDLCARLPYGVKILHEGWNFEWDDELSTVEKVVGIDKDFIYTKVINTHNGEEYRDDKWPIDTFDDKLFLRPMLSMTDDQCCDFYCRFVENEIDYNDFKKHYFDGCLWNKVLTTINDCSDIIDWFNKNHFDYRGLIDKGLAIDATGLNIY